MSEELYRQRLLQHSKTLVDILKPDDVVSKLFQSQCISHSQYERLKRECDGRGPHAMNRLLLKIFEEQHTNRNAIEIFVQILEDTGQKYLAHLLKHEVDMNETLSEVDKRKIQGHFNELVQNMNTSKVIAHLKREKNYFTAFEIQEIESKTKDIDKANYLLLEVIEKGTYRHLYGLKKALIELGLSDLASYLPVSSPNQGPREKQVHVEGTIHCDTKVNKIRPLLITIFMDADQQLNKKLKHLYSLSNITAEASPANAHVLHLNLELSDATQYPKIEGDIKSGHLEKIIKQHSYLNIKANWRISLQLNKHDSDERSYHFTHHSEPSEIGLQMPQFASSKLSTGNPGSDSGDSGYSSTYPGSMLEKEHNIEAVTSGTTVNDPIAHASFKPSPTATLNPGHLKEQIFYTIHEKDFTPFDFGQAISNCKQANVTSSDIKTLDGLNILHTCIDKGRLSYLPILVIVGWWNILSKEKVAENSPNEHKGKTAKQIAESKRAKKPLAEFNSANEWDTSLSPLMRACRSGDLSRARQLIHEGGEEIFYCDYNGGNALFWAVIYGDVNLIEDLLQMGVDPTVRTKKKENLLHVACLVGNSNIIHKLLTKSLKIDPWLQDNTSKTPLDRNAENGDISTVIKFVEKGIKPKPNSVPLCAFVGRKLYLEHLLDTLKMAVDSEDIYSRTALHRACEGNKIDIVRLLLNKKADITKITCTGRSLIHILAENGSMELMLMILSLFRERGILDRFISVQDRYNGVELCFLIRGRDKGRDAWHYVEVKRYLVPVFLIKTKSGNVDVAIYGEVINSETSTNFLVDIGSGPVLEASANDRPAPLSETTQLQNR